LTPLALKHGSKTTTGPPSAGIFPPASSAQTRGGRYGHNTAKAIVDDITSIPGNQREFYVQKIVKVSGREKTVWALHIHGAQELPEVRALASDHSRIKGDAILALADALDGLQQCLTGAAEPPNSEPISPN
jgi:hypothetical protein